QAARVPDRRRTGIPLAGPCSRARRDLLRRRGRIHRGRGQESPHPTAAGGDDQREAGRGLLLKTYTVSPVDTSHRTKGTEPKSGIPAKNYPRGLTRRREIVYF